MAPLASIAVLAILILIHELGHFVAARSQGIYANRFSLGFGPVLWKYQGPQTEYALRAFPLGGFVGFPDDDPDSEIPPDDPNLLSNRPILDRTIVISAGVIANFLFAFLLLTVQAAAVGIPDSNILQPGISIPAIVEEADAPAVVAGLQKNDAIVAVNGITLGDEDTVVESFRDLVRESPEQPLQLTVQRKSETLEVTIVPRLEPETGIGKIGVALMPNRRAPQGFGEIFAVASDEYQRIFTLTFQGFGQLIGNFQESARQVTGPVGIVAVGARVASNNAASLLQFAALISINLGVINILPLPVLDGGQLAFLAYEAVRGEPLPSRIQENITRTGVLMLLMLAIVLVIRDTANITGLPPVDR
ncbi:MAG: RIP metalloprotease RseP [Cyanobacteria bacterium J06641_5]